jgi:outer membrane lipase/esterase
VTPRTLERTTGTVPWIGALAALMLITRPGYTQTVPEGGVTGSLVTLINTAPAGTFNALEQLSAVANQASYNAMTANPNAAVFCNPGQVAASPTCPAAVFLVFSNLRELVQTANALLNNGGPTRYSLNLDDRGLGFALRWTAAEELSAPGSVARQFLSGQLSSVASRIAALRFGASGFTVGGLSLQQAGRPALAVNAPQVLGGGASADSSDVGIASRWGGFLNGAFGWGYREPSTFEDAFAFDSKDVTLGVDYRLTRRLVLGVSAGYTNQRIDFDPSASVVGGGIRSHGLSAMVYANYEWEGPYVSAAAGYQHLTYSTTRLITYPSLNIAEPSVDATAYGSTHSSALLLTASAGWFLSHNAASVEPYINADYRRIRLAGYRERSVDNVGGGPAGFDFDYAPQQINILDASVGVRLQYVLRPAFGVLTPYAKVAYHHNFAANNYSVSSAYNAISSSGAGFDLPTDSPDNHFYEFAGGFSVVLKHGIQGFVQFQIATGMQFVTSRMISGGIRGEF